MLLNRRTLEAIRSGAVTLVFRRWRRPTVKAGGTLLTSLGQLRIEAVDRMAVASLTEADARAAGFADLGGLRAFLDRRADGDLYRIRVGALEADPRERLRAAAPGQEELRGIADRLGRLDSRSPHGPWTRRVLELIARRPAVRAGDLAQELGRDRAEFKADVRKLKALGLTESLAVGYRLSPRGRAVLEALDP